jgi:hypothetical protein
LRELDGDVSTGRFDKGFLRGAGLCLALVIAVWFGGCCLSGEIDRGFAAAPQGPTWWFDNGGLIFLGGAFLSLIVGVLSGLYAVRVGSSKDKDREE